jgi:hypothetical protein
MTNRRTNKASSSKALSGSRKEISGYTWIHRSTALAIFGAAALALTACDGNTGGGSGGTGGDAGSAGDTSSGGTGGAGGGSSAQASKVDILFAIDNSRSMADKQAILSLALDDLLSGLANPPCLDASGQIAVQPVSPFDTCPPGSDRQYQPVTDIHIGVISSSIGGHGADACDPSQFPSNNDKAHLLDRLDPAGGGAVPTYQGQGFLAWDPVQQMGPPGEADPAVIASSFKDMVLGVGQVGCGYESQLESLYRFLVDPAPYQSISIGPNGTIEKSGVDNDLLAQRAAFLRPDSLLLVLSLSDENDCSIREEGQYYYVAQQKGPGGAPFHLPAARSECAADPNDPCCASCGQAPPDGCAPDPSCQAPGGGAKMLTDLEDNINLRCFDQKRRFGIDFLYPVDRYTQAFTSQTITDASGQVVQNPLFAGGRASNLVMFAGVVGVPWQSVAKNPSDLAQGFKNAAELAQADGNGMTTWDKILGDPAANQPPADPFMIESIVPRAGVAAGNPVNGGERTIAQNDDLQYACLMPIPAPRDCTDPAQQSCDCFDAANDNPLCEMDPATGGQTLQTRAKAYPGLRQLGLMKSLGENAVVGSICAGQIDNSSTPDYAYRPVVSSILAGAKTRLQ